jgi:hypothetical protein
MVPSQANAGLNSPALARQLTPASCRFTFSLYLEGLGRYCKGKSEPPLAAVRRQWLIAQQIHVSGRGIEQHLLLGDTQGLARRAHLTFRLTAPIGGLEAVEHGVGARGADRARIEVLREWAGDESAGERKHRCRALLVVAARGCEAELRAIARQSLRHSDGLF